MQFKINKITIKLDKAVNVYHLVNLLCDEPGIVLDDNLQGLIILYSEFARDDEKHNYFLHELIVNKKSKIRKKLNILTQ